MSAHCHDCVFTGQSRSYKRILVTVIVLNLMMFFVELGWGIVASSQALLADSLDLLGDGLTYGLSLWAINQSASRRSYIAMLKAFSLLIFALVILVDNVMRTFAAHTPIPLTMGWVATLVLVVNISSAVLLYKFREGDANIQSVWLCSRNDAIGNVGVMIAAGLVYLLQAGWPDLLAAGILVTLFTASSIRIFRLSLAEMRLGRNQQS